MDREHLACEACLRLSVTSTSNVGAHIATGDLEFRVCPSTRQVMTMMRYKNYK
jgi:hypothetical protein